MKQTLTKLARWMYLDEHAAVDFPEQEPQCDSARWWDLLWLAVPLFGTVMMVNAIDRRYRREHPTV